MKNKKLILIFILFLAAFLRFYQLNKLPPGFHVDEVSIGYNAYSLMKTGKDENGNFLPLYIDSFGDFRPAGYFYLTIPAIKIFGLNEFAVRFSSAFFGLLAVLLTYLLAREINFDSPAAIFYGLIASFLLAISPWHIIISRATSEASVALSLILAGACLFLRALRKQSRSGFLFSFLLFFITFYFYHTPRVFVPLLVLGIVALSWQKIKGQRMKAASIVFLTICLLVSFLTILLGPGTGRFKQVSVFNNPGVQLRLDEQIREEFPGTSIFLIRAFHNKLVNYGLEILSNYGKYFSLDFLFLKGGLPIRYLVPETGLLHLIELPFLILGILFLFKGKLKLAFLPAYWMLIGPIASSLTFEDIPNIQRTLFMLPSFQILTACGFYKSRALFKNAKLVKSLLILGSLLVLVFNLSYFLHQYLVHQRVYRPWYRNYGLKELVMSLNEMSPNYQKTLITKSHNDPYIYILFYNQYDPARYQEVVYRRTNNEWELDNYVFCPEDCPSYEKKKVFREEKTLFVDKGECKTRPYAQILKTIFREDNTPVFHLLEIDKKVAEEYFEKVENLTKEELRE